jgi:glutamate racemase
MKKPVYELHLSGPGLCYLPHPQWPLAKGVFLRSELPIGVFDSGVGGLTVVRAIQALLPNEHILYLGDTARVPYGTRSPDTVKRYTERVAGHLVQRGIKALVVACNTATTYALKALQRDGARHGVEVIGVIAPGVQAALAQGTISRIGVIGTEGTIRGGLYARLIQERRPGLSVKMVACPLFVALAEEGWTDGDVAQITAHRYLNSLAGSVDTVILGCTHYPLLRNSIAKALPGVTLVDSATATATALSAALRRRGIARTANEPGAMHFLVTDNLDRFRRVGARFLGTPPDPVELIDLMDFDAEIWNEAEAAS